MGATGCAPNLVECRLRVFEIHLGSSRAIICHSRLRTLHIDAEGDVDLGTRGRHRFLSECYFIGMPWSRI